MKNLTVEELISRYDIVDGAMYGKPGQLTIRNRRCVEQDGMQETMATIKSRKPEILAYFKAEKEAKERAAAEREAKINAIPGLTEIRNAQRALAAWDRKFERSFEGEYACGGFGVGPRPKVDITAMRKQYPIADAFLRAEHEVYSGNAELSAIGKKAMDAIIDNPHGYAAAMAQMESDISGFVDCHAWD